MRWIAGTLAFLIISTIAAAHPPAGIAVDDQGRVYMMQVAVGVWRVETDGAVALTEGTGFHHIELDPAGKFLNQRWPSFPDGVIRPAGKNPTVLCVSSFPVAIGQDGALYYPEPLADGHVHILRLEAGGKPTDFAKLPVAIETMPDGTSSPATWIHGFSAAPGGAFVYAEKEGIRRIDAKGEVSTVVDKITLSECVRPPAITDDRGGVVLRNLDVADDGTIYAASAGCSALLKVTPAGEVSVALQERDGWAPTDVEVAHGKIYVLEYHYTDVQHPVEWNPRVRVIAADGAVSTLATAPKTPARPGHRLQ